MSNRITRGCYRHPVATSPLAKFNDASRHPDWQRRCRASFCTSPSIHRNVLSKFLMLISPSHPTMQCGSIGWYTDIGITWRLSMDNEHTTVWQFWCSFGVRELRREFLSFKGEPILLSGCQTGAGAGPQFRNCVNYLPTTKCWWNGFWAGVSIKKIPLTKFSASKYLEFLLQN